ncbi:hypothetical protein CUMW_133910 [Citrus unshiu]|nr:hypothetical protein CUMW_133910 [Citrus unshiu]
MAFDNTRSALSVFFVALIAVLLTSAAGYGVAEVPPGGTLLYAGHCNNDSDCTELCKSKGEYIPRYGVVCRKHSPPYQSGPPNDCFCKMVDRTPMRDEAATDEG